MNNRLSKLTLAILSASTMGAAFPSLAQETPESEASDAVEVIEVRGIASSIAESARLKRFDSRIVDAIVAEDIGKLPDNNIAEALQRITGVSISRDFGVGESVTIRGISQNRVELNGRSTSGSGRGGISLDDFPSSFLKTVEVVKSPTPEMIEGALGGTINMTTVRPLELSEPLVAITLDGEYADKAENWAPMFTGAAGTNWDLGDAGTFGASVVMSYQDRTLRRDEFFNLVTPTELDLDGDGNSDAANTPSGNYLVRSQNTVEQKTEQRERTAFGLSLQWAPKDTDAFVYLDINATDLDGGQEAYSVLNDSKDYSDLVLDNAYGDAQGQLHNFGSGSVFVQPKTWADFTTNESMSNALGGEWFITDKIKLSGEVADTKAESLRTNSEFNLRPISREQYEEDGTITAGNASGINDGASAVLVASGRRVKELGLTPIARIASYASFAMEPMNMGLGPVGASRQALHKAGWSVADLDVIEVNEAFAAQSLAVQKEMGWDLDKCNPHGGAIALGHPLAASGNRIVVTLVHELKRRGKGKGLATLCIGGGMGVAICVEAV